MDQLFILMSAEAEVKIKKTKKSWDYGILSHPKMIKKKKALNRLKKNLQVL